MALQLGALRDALDAAGFDKDLARKASEEVASYQGDTSATRLYLSEVKGRVNLVTWMVTSNLAFTVVVLGKLFGAVG